VPSGEVELGDEASDWAAIAAGGSLTICGCDEDSENPSHG